jgi:hypothetical protein
MNRMSKVVGTVLFEVTQSRVFPSGRVFLRSEPKR